MRLRVDPSALLALLVLPWLATRSSAQAANDNCANATPIVGGASGAITAATPDGITSCTAGIPDLWYRLDAQVSGTADVRVCPAAPFTLDPALSIHSSCAGTPMAEIACLDDGGLACAAGARIVFPVTMGATYRIRVAAEHGTTGPFTMTVTTPAWQIPVNDRPEHAVAIGPGGHDTFNARATADPEGGIFGVWFRYTPAIPGPAVVDTCSFSIEPDSIVSSRTCVLQGGAPPPGLSFSSCSGSGIPRHSWPAQAGVEYMILAGDSIDSGSMRLNLAGPPSVLDDCTSPPTLELGSQSASLVGASADGSSTCSPLGSPDVAWRFTPATDGVLSISTCGSNDYPALDRGEFTVVSVHSGCPPTAANELACSSGASACSEAGSIGDAFVSAIVHAGIPVVVRVGNLATSPYEGPFLLETSFEPGIPFCEGSQTPCPCANAGIAGHGCAHSQSPRGARLSASGEPSVTSDSLVLRGTEMPGGSIALYVQGTTMAGVGALFGDGLRCVAGTVVRLGARANVNGTSAFGAVAGGGVHASSSGMLPPSGGTRHYQACYRDAASFCTSATFNATNGLSISWRP